MDLVPRCKCDLCDDPEYPIRLSPATKRLAKRYFGSLVNLTPEQRGKLRALKKKNETKICSKHFRKEVDEEEEEEEEDIPSPQVSKRNCDLCDDPVYPIQLSPDSSQRAQKYFESRINPTPEERGKIRALAAQKQTAKVCMKHFRKEEEEEEKKKEDGDEKEEDIPTPYVSKCKCDLCDDPEYPIHLSPINRQRAKRYFESLVNLTPEQRGKVRAIELQEKEAKICSKHFLEEVDEEEEDIPIPAVSESKCDLCVVPEYPIWLSPINTQLARRYFESLINLTPEQRGKLLAIAQKNETKICSMHFRMEQEEEEEEDDIPAKRPRG